MTNEELQKFVHDNRHFALLHVYREDLQRLLDDSKHLQRVASINSASFADLCRVAETVKQERDLARAKVELLMREVERLMLRSNPVPTR